MLSSRSRRSVGWWLAGAAVAGGALLGGYATQAAQAAQAVPAAMGTQPGAVQLKPASGPTSSTPTWSTSMACPTGFQDSATFKEVHADGSSTNFIAPIVNKTGAPFSGTLQASIARIQQAGGIANGGTQELFVTCFSGFSGTGNARNEMNIYVTYSADGTSYKTTTTAPASTATSTSGGGASSATSPASPGGAGASSGSVPNVAPGPSSSTSRGADPSPSASVAPSPSALDSSFAVTG